MYLDCTLYRKSGPLSPGLELGKDPESVESSNPPMVSPPPYPGGGGMNTLVYDITTSTPVSSLRSQETFNTLESQRPQE